MLVDHGDEVIIPTPYWVSFKDIVNYGGGKCVFVETDESQGFKLTARMVEQAITPRTKVILLNSPNNPTGAVVTPEDTAEIVKMAAARGIYVISDECYVYLNYTGKLFSAASICEGRDLVLIVGSLSKTYAMTGWRLGDQWDRRQLLSRCRNCKANQLLIRHRLSKKQPSRRCGIRKRASPKCAKTIYGCALRS